MAGGGGTRLRPAEHRRSGPSRSSRCSRRARPSSSAPCAGSRRRARARSTCSSSHRRPTRRWSRRRCPRRGVVDRAGGPQHRRRDRARGARRSTAPDDEVMVVLPADHRIDPAREGAFRGSSPPRPTGLAGGAFGIERPLVTLGVQPTYPATQYGYLVPRHEARRADRGAPRLPARGVRGEARSRTAPATSSACRAWPGTRGCSCGAAGAIRAALEKCAPDVAAAVEPALARSGDMAAAYATITPALDRLRGDGARGAASAGS